MKTIKIILISFLILVTSANFSWATRQKMTDLTLGEQISIIKKDLAESTPEVARDAYILYDYIMKQKKKTWDPIVAYLVAKRAVEQVLTDNRFDHAMPKSSYLALIVGIMHQESGFNPYAVSHANARGLMQVHVPTWRKYIEVDKIHDVKKNIQYGASIFHKYFSEQGTITKALFKYYGAPDSGYARAVLSHSLRFKRFYEQNLSLSTRYIAKIREEYQHRMSVAMQK